MLAASLLVGGCSPLAALNALVPESGYERTAALSYGQGPRQVLDVYRPVTASRAPQPVVVFFYGGSWQAGARGDYRFVAEALTAKGYVVVIPDYRVYPEVTYPGFVEDGAAALEWTVRNVGRHGGDARRIVLMGHSAGAHIAAMLAYNPMFLDPQVRQALRGIVGLAGPYDFVPTDPVIRRILEVNGASEVAMPARYVRGGEPASLLVTGDRDSTVSPENTRRLAQRLRAAGSAVEELHIPGLTHYTVLLGLSAPFRDDALLAPIDSFLRRATR